MIARLRGKVLEKNPMSVVVDVGGVGYLVSVPLTVSSAIHGAEADLYVQTEVREDSIQLFGFLRREERQLFCTLRDIHGIGPQTALAILSSMSLEEFFSALREQNPKRFLGVPKVGKKTAERILLELKEKKLDFFSSAQQGPDSVQGAPGDPYNDAVTALETLGYRTQEAVRAADEARRSSPGAGAEELIRIALQKLSP